MRCDHRLCLLLFVLSGYIVKLSSMLNFLKNIGPLELIILVSILTLLFGRKAFISLGRTAGESLKEIKKIKKNFNEAIDEEPSKDSKEVSN